MGDLGEGRWRAACVMKGGTDLTLEDVTILGKQPPPIPVVPKLVRKINSAAERLSRQQVGVRSRGARIALHRAAARAVLSALGREAEWGGRDRRKEGQATGGRA